MSLQTIQLDNLNWQQIVTAIRARIIPDSKGKWTFQAPVDPGVTLLELFAWLLDQRIYWMNQVPDPLVLSILSLLGEAPRAAQAAVTVLQLADSAIPPRDFPVAAAGTLMRLGDTNPPILFTLDQDLAVLPTQAISLSVNGVDRTNDLSQGRSVALLPSGQTSSQIRFLLQLNKKMVVAAGNSFSLLLQLDTPLDVFPQWSFEAVTGVAPPATLTWSYTSTASRSSVTFTSAQVEDGTAGLRRSGIVRFALPADWQPEAGTDPAITTYAITLDIASAGYTFAPQLLGVKSNAVLAHHIWKRSVQPNTSNWLPLPGNVISLPGTTNFSLWKEYPPIEDSVQVTITGRDDKPTAWTRVSDLSRSGPTDNVFVIDRSRAQISFGNGLTGRLPVLSATANPAIVVNYSAGAGLAGNVGENSQWAAVTEKPGDPEPLFTAVNPAAGDGGTESETLQQAQHRSEASLNERNRAVSQLDYQNLAITTPGVAIRRAYAAIGYQSEFPCSTVPGAVTVFVVPYAPRIQTDGSIPSGSFVPAPQPDPGALQAVQARLHTAKLLGGQVFVSAPIYRLVWLSLAIAVDSALSAALRQEILTGLQTFLDPLVGGEQGNGWPFGDPLRPSALLKIAQDILGDAGDILSVGIRIDGMQAAESCRDTSIRPCELVNLVHVDLATQRRTPQSGGLR
jgi:hypothetical protein